MDTRFRGQFFRHVASMAGGTALGQVVVIAALPLLSRLYTPEDFGVFGIFSAFVAVAGVAVCLRLDMAIASAHTDEDADRLLAICLMALPVATFLATGVFLVARDGDWLSLSAMPGWAALALFMVLGVTGLFSLLRFWNARRFGFDLVARALVRQGFGRAVASVLAGLTHGGWLGLVLGELVGRSLGIARLAKEVLPRLAALKRSTSPGESGGVLRRYWKFPALALPSSLIDAAGGAIPVMLIADTFSTVFAGHFAMVGRIASLPAAFIAASVGDVFHSHFRASHASNAGEARDGIRRLALRLLLVAVAIYVPAGLLAPFVLPPVLGDVWIEAANQLRILAPFFAVTLIVSPLSRVLAVTNRLELKLIVDIVLLLIPLWTLWLFPANDPHSALALYVWANVAAYGLYFGLIWYAAGRAAPVTSAPG